MKTSKADRRLAAVAAASHRKNVEAAAAADRHAKSFSEMFAITSDASALEPSAQYLADLERNAR